MGLFDTVHCDYPLPDPQHQSLDFQTKDLECFLAHFTITHDGRLVCNARRGGRGPEHNIEWPLHGDLRIYTSRDGAWIEYVVRFTHDRVEWIRPQDEVAPAPELPKDWWSPFPAILDNGVLEAQLRSPNLQPAPQVEAKDETGEDAVAPANAEEALLQSLQRDRQTLEKLLKENSSHWGYEDPVYRFYHQSFKVYGLQRQTRSIVRQLQTLAPDRPLNAWFVQIIESGTGKAFKPEDNARWTEVTKPILEAFFHARFFLEMAVRSADLPAPPQTLPSGYAALLYLFGLR
jgi:hypothetical protein